MRAGDVDSGEYQGIQETTWYTTSITFFTTIFLTFRRPLDSGPAIACHLKARLSATSHARLGVAFPRFKILPIATIRPTGLWNWISIDTRLGELGERAAAGI